jgi:uncharacterized protein
MLSAVIARLFTLRREYPLDKRIHETHFVLTEDNKRIALNHFHNHSSHVVIIAPGFYNNKNAFLFKGIREAIQRHFDVIVFDFRGHGESSGLYSWTAHEKKDLRSVVAFAKAKQYKRIGVLGFSLGAATALIEAATNSDIHSLIAVSTPYDFWKINYHVWEEEMWEDLKLNLGIKGRGKGVRPSHPFSRKEKPIDMVSRIKDIPVLFVHGEKDWLIKPSHTQKLFERANEPKAMRLMKAGHAEKIFDALPDEFEKVCVDWFKHTL